jgi:error-prone DNA polymerase
VPDPPPLAKQPRPLPTQAASRGFAGPRYAELHCKTNFSFLEGASHPDELVERAAAVSYAALAITDRNSLAGVVRAHVAAKAVGLKLLIGAEITPLDAPPVLLWAMDRAGYGRLSTLITQGRRNAPKGECRLTVDQISRHAEGLLAGIIPSVEPMSSDSLARYREAFSDRAYLIAELHRGPDDRSRLAELRSLALASNLPLVAANDVHYHLPLRQPLHDVMTATRHRCTVAELGDRRFPNAERYLKAPAVMASLFATCSDAIDRTGEIADRCDFSLDELKYEYPHELCPAGTTPTEYLTQLTWQGARDRYPQGIPDKVRRLLDHELALITDLKYEAYFLTVWDLVRFARSRDILCQGRGSAANSAVCYCLGVTAVDPDHFDLLFERFISKERGEAPDIDIDFEHERREEVLQYLYNKYGRDRAGMTATLITYRPRSAVRDVGKALGLSLDRVDRLAKNLDHYDDPEILAGRFRESGLDPLTPVGKHCLDLTRELLGFPRHLSQHVGGMVMTQGPLHELVPIENASMPGRTVIEWDKDDLDALGLLKVDCLCLGMLTAIRKCFSLIERWQEKPLQSSGSQPLTLNPHRLTLAAIPQDDPAVYDMICRADTIGLFQIESRAQMSMLPRLQPRCFYDLVIEVAIVRPGPIQGDMVHPYLRRRRGDEPVTYPDDRIREVLHKTLGVPLFQEQAMKLAVVAAGFTPGEADQLRRAMAAWRRKGGLEPFRQKLIDGMQARGYDIEFAERLYKQICGFGEYGFPESHAASFAQLAYVSAWLKHYHPAAYTAAILNSQPMGFYGPAQLVADARNHGVEVRPPDVNASDWECTLEPTDCQGPAIRLGLCMVQHLPQAAASRIIETRESGPFRSVEEFADRTRIPRANVITLSRADAFASLSLARRPALWDALPSRESGHLLPTPPQPDTVPLPDLSPFQEVAADYQTVGLSLKAHPMSFLREQLTAHQVTRASDLKHCRDGARIQVAGLVLLRQRPATAKGVTFMTLEDETGTMNLIVRPDIWKQHRQAARSSSALLVSGTLQHREGIIHIIPTRLEDLTANLSSIPQASRDFR